MKFKKYIDLWKKIISKKLENPKTVRSIIKESLDDKCYIEHRNKILELINKYIDKHIDKINHNLQLCIIETKSVKIYPNYYKTEIGDELFSLCERFINNYKIIVDGSDCDGYYNCNIIDEDENFPHIICIKKWCYDDRFKHFSPSKWCNTYNNKDKITTTLNIQIKKKKNKNTIFT